MAKKNIKTFHKFQDVPGLNAELDRIIKQIQEQIGGLEPAIGEIFIDQDPAIVITVATPGTYYLVGGMITGENVDTEVLSTGFRTKKKGIYGIIVSTSFTADINNTIVHMSVFVNGIMLGKTRKERKVGTGGDFGSMSMSGYVRSTSTDLIQLELTADKACDVTINHLNFKIKQERSL